MDIVHKQTTKSISILNGRGMQTVALGNVRNIRQKYLCKSTVVGVWHAP